MSKITVIIPTYNVEKYIDICLSALLVQSFADFEVLCVDDCSTDNTLSIIKQYAKFDKRIKLIESKQNSVGPDVLRGIGISLVQSPYTVFVDADDLFSPFMLQKYLENIEENDSDWVYGGGNVLYYEENCTPCPRNTLPNDVFLHYVRGKTFCPSDVPSFFPFKMSWEFWGKMFKTEFIKGSTFKPYIAAQDISFFFKMFFKAQKISYVLEPLYVYRYKRASSITSSANKSRLGIFHSLDEIRQTIENAGEFEKYKNAYIDFKLSHLWYYLLTIAPNMQQDFFEYAKETFGKEDFSSYDFNVLRKNKFYFPTLNLQNCNFEEFKALYLNGAEDE